MLGEYRAMNVPDEARLVRVGTQMLSEMWSIVPTLMMNTSGISTNRQPAIIRRGVTGTTDCGGAADDK